MVKPPEIGNSMKLLLSLVLKGQRVQVVFVCLFFSGTVNLEKYSYFQRQSAKAGKEKDKNTPTCVSSCPHVIHQYLPQWPDPSRLQSLRESGQLVHKGQPPRTEKSRYQIWQNTQRINSLCGSPTYHSRVLTPAITCQILSSITEELKEPFLATIEMT